MPIAIEASKLMEVYQWDTDMSADEVRVDAESVERIREEVADVLIYSMDLAIELDIDLLEGWRRSSKPTKTGRLWRESLARHHPVR